MQDGCNHDRRANNAQISNRQVPNKIAPDKSTGSEDTVVVKSRDRLTPVDRQADEKQL